MPALDPAFPTKSVGFRASKMIGALIILIAYFLGAIPFGYLLVRWKTGQDVRASGSGNIGATNVLRTTSRSLGIVTLLLDIGKGVLAVWIAAMLTTGFSPGLRAEWMAAAALAVMAGHAFPVFLKFHGGKAVASYVGAFLYLVPLALGIVLLVFVLVVWRTRYISLASVLGAAALPVVMWLVPGTPLPYIVAAAIGGAFIIWRHKGNLARLRAGTENALSLGSRPGNRDMPPDTQSRRGARGEGGV